MIDRAFLQRIGLSEDQIVLLMDGLSRESRFREILLQVGVYPGVVEGILRATKLEEVDFSNEPLLREKVRAEWSGFCLNNK